MGIYLQAAELNEKIIKHLGDRKPDFTVGKDYLRRWYLIPRNPFFNIYYHIFRESDDPRFLHDHFYLNFSLILQGSYIEHTLKGKFERNVGDFKLRLPHTLHRIEIPENKECRTLFITGPRVRNWGFQLTEPEYNFLGFRKKKGWLDHETYVKFFCRDDQNG